MAVTIKPIPSSFPCPSGTIFTLPTKEDLVNGINDIAKIPSELRVFLVEVGDQITEEAKQEVEEAIEDIEKFMESLGDLLSPYWEKGTIRNWQKEANDAITELLADFHTYIPTKIAEIISKIVPINFNINLFGLSIDILRIFDKAYQKELKDQIGGMTPDFKKKLKELEEDLKNDRITQEDYDKMIQELMEGKSKIIDKFFNLIPESLRGFDGEKYGLKCDEWKAKMTFQYIKTQIKEYLTNTLHAVFGKLIKIFDKIWKLLGLPGLVSLFTKPDIGAIIDGLIETAVEKRKELLKKLEDPLLSDEEIEEIRKQIEELSGGIISKIKNFSIFGFSINSIIGEIETTVQSLEEQVTEMKLAFEDFIQNWQKKLLFDWVNIVKKFFDKIGLGKIFDFLTLTFCDVLKILGFPFSINVKTPQIEGVTTTAAA
tara:strand:- start:1081 stop:2367 length:1287 start_codon:yes stop_codon:yes gene_type:complete